MGRCHRGRIRLPTNDHAPRNPPLRASAIVEQPRYWKEREDGPKWNDQSGFTMGALYAKGIHGMASGYEARPLCRSPLEQEIVQSKLLCSAGLRTKPDRAPPEARRRPPRSDGPAHSFFCPEPERVRQVHRQGKNDGRAPFSGDIKQGTKIAKLHGLRPLGEDLARLRQPLRSLKLTLRVYDFGAPKRSASACLAMARIMVSLRSMCLSSTLLTLIPHASVRSSRMRWTSVLSFSRSASI